MRAEATMARGMGQVHPRWRQALAEIRASVPFWLLIGLLVLAFLTGGGSRGDVASLVVLRPLAVLALGAGCMSLKLQQLREYRVLFALAAAVLLLVLVELVPLPPGVANGLPGHGIIGEIDRTVEIQGHWRPMTMTPAATRNALWALMVPLAVLVLGVQLTSAQRASLVSVLLVLGLASGLLALLQILGDPEGPLYLYRQTNNGAAVGLFANRNHQAVLLACLLPMLAVWLRLNPQRRRRSSRRPFSPRTVCALLAGLFLIPLILVTGSRAGMMAAAIGLVSLPLLLKRRDHPASPSSAKPGRTPSLAAPWLLIPLLAGLVALTIWLDRAEAVRRLLASSPAEEMRLKILPTLWQMIGNYLPWGSGFGSFEQVYRLYEPDELLSPTYMNHAHNDWLEIVLTGGLPACLLVIFAVATYYLSTVRVFRLRGARPNVLLARLGLVVILLLALASLSDYPLRVPSLACLLVLAAVWAAAPDEADGPVKA